MFAFTNRVERRRLAALSMAVEFCREGGNPQDVRDAAAMFEKFLAGEVSDPITRRRENMLAQMHRSDASNWKAA